MRYFNTQLESLDMYQRQIYYWSVLFDRRNNIQVLDNVNFSSDVFPEILKISEIVKLHPLEPGYGSPDASCELAEIIRKFEFERLMKHQPERRQLNEQFSQEAGVGCAIGTTNVMSSILKSITQLTNREYRRANSHPEIILVLPNYAVYAAQVRQMIPSIKPVFVNSKRENGFLATYEDIAEAVTENTIAIVITYPNNPAQTTYEGERLFELKLMIEFCQKSEIFLVIDTIYQDLLFPSGRRFEEPFGLSESLNYLVKVYSPSKDTPFFSGYRIGYWFGDPRLTENFRFQVSADINALTTISMSLLGVSLLIRSLLLSQEQLLAEHLNILKSGMFGWRSDIDINKSLDKFLEMNLIENYKSRMAISNSLQEKGIKLVRDFCKSSLIFEDFCNEDIGNVCFLKLDNSFYQGSDDSLVELLMDKVGVGVLPGNVFGIPMDSNEVWIRITLTHDHVKNIISGLEKIEDYFAKRR